MIINNQGHCGAIIQVIWDELIKVDMTLKGGVRVCSSPWVSALTSAWKYGFLMHMLICFPLHKKQRSLVCNISPLRPPASSLPPVCNLLPLTDTCTVLTSIRRPRLDPARSRLSLLIRLNDAQAQCTVNHQNLLADLLKNGWKLVCERVCRGWDSVQWCDSFEAVRRQLSAKKKNVCVCWRWRFVQNVRRGVQGSPGVQGKCQSPSFSLSHTSSHLTAGSAWLRRDWKPMRLDGPCHMCSVRAVGEARGPEESGGGDVCWGTAGSYHLIHWLFLSHRLSNLSSSCQFYVLFLYYVHSVSRP